MKAYERRRKLNHVVTDVAFVMANHDDLARKLNDLAGAFPTSSGGAVGGPGTILHCFEHGEDSCPCGNNTTIAAQSDPTGSAAGRPDPALKALEEFDRLINQLGDIAGDLVRITTRWTTTTKLLPDTEGEPGCEIVARITNKATKRPHFEEAHVYSDVKGNLDRKYRLGRWAYEHVLRTGVVPNLDETRQHINGQKIKCTHQQKRRAS